MSETIILSDRGNENLIEDIRKSGINYAYDESLAIADYKRDADIIPDPTQPMWEVYMDGTRTTGRLLHMTGIDDSSRYILNGKLSLEVGEAGSFSFSITPHHTLYDVITPYKTTVTVYQEGVELFRGRVTGYTTDIQRQRNVTCEGDLSYLSDIVFPNSEISLKNRKLSAAFGYFIQLYNKFGKFEEGDARYLLPGDVTIGKESYTVKISEWIGTDKNKTEFTDSRALIDEFISTFGGYLRTKRYEDGFVHLEYISGYTDVNDQVIAYGSNLQELTIDSKLEDLFTVLVPLGDGFTSDDSLTIGAAATETDDTVRGATLSHKKGSKWNNNELIWDEGVALYGRIIRQESFNGIANVSELYSRAKAYFRECIASHLGNFTVKAVDMHFADPSYRPIYLGQKVRIVSPPHGIDTADQMLTCMKVEYDLTSPEATLYEFDVPFQPLTDTFRSKYKKRQKQQERQTSKAKSSAKKANKKNKSQDGDIAENGNKIKTIDANTEHDMNAMKNALEKAGIDVSGLSIHSGSVEPPKYPSATQGGVDMTEDPDGQKYKFDNGGLYKPMASGGYHVN